MLPRRIAYTFIVALVFLQGLVIDAQNVDFTSWSYSISSETASTNSGTLFHITKATIGDAATGPMLRGGPENLIPNAADSVQSLAASKTKKSKSKKSSPSSPSYGGVGEPAEPGIGDYRYWGVGEPAEPGIFSHQVFLQDYSGEFRCGGSLISADLVLTAANCLDPPLDIAKLNLYDIYNDAGVEKIQVCETLAHPGYERSHHEEHDIALLRLCSASELVLNGTIKPVILDWSVGFAENATVVVSGWGKNDKGRISNRILQEAVLSYISEEACSASYSKANRTITRNQICVDAVGLNACHGDSGGALIFGNSSHFIQVGVASHVTDVDACPSKTPGIFSSILEENYWIQEYGCRLTSIKSCGSQWEKNTTVYSHDFINLSAISCECGILWETGTSNGGATSVLCKNGSNCSPAGKK